MARRIHMPPPETPAAESRRKTARDQQLKQLLPGVWDLLKTNNVGQRLVYEISRIKPPEDQIPVARALCEGRINKRALHAALSGDEREGYRRKIIDLCKKGQVILED